MGGYTAAVTVPITAEDLTTPGFSSAKRGLLDFEATNGRSFTKMVEAARLFSQETGVRLPRALVSLMAGSAAVGPILSAIFPVVAAIGFLEILSQAITRLRELALSATKTGEAIRVSVEIMTSIRKGTEKVKELDDAYKRLGKTQKEIMELNVADAAFKLAAIQVDISHVQSLIADLKAQKKAAEDLTQAELQRQRSAKEGGVARPPGQLYPRTVLPAVPGAKDLEEFGGMAEGLERRLEELRGGAEGMQVAIKLLQTALKNYGDEVAADREKTADFAKTMEEFRQSQLNKFLDTAHQLYESSEKLELPLDADEIDRQALALQQQIDKLKEFIKVNSDPTKPKIFVTANEHIELLSRNLDAVIAKEEFMRKYIPVPPVAEQTKALTFPETPFAYAGTKEEMEHWKVLNDINYAQDEYRKIVTETMTPMQAYDAALGHLADVYLHSSMNVDQLTIAYRHIKDTMDPVTVAWQKFGESAGQAINAALLFGRSWTDALKSIIALLIETILQVTILNSLKESGKGGGFLGTFISGLAGGGLFGHAYGGEVAANVPIMVGEKGPELWVPPAAGKIIPNDQLQPAGRGPTYYIDNRGATMESMMELRRFVLQSHDQAVIKAVYLTKELDRRT